MCRFNPASLARAPDLENKTRRASARCEIRDLAIPEPFHTCCANFHTGSTVPDGPVFSASGAGERLPWHDAEPVRLRDDGRLAVRDGGTERAFEKAAAYLRWWSSAHPGESGDYPWPLHDRMYGFERRASGHDRPRLIEWVRALFNR
jgi:hypothetical protein